MNIATATATTPSPINTHPHHAIPLLVAGAAVDVCTLTLVVWLVMLAPGAGAFSVRVLVPDADWVTVVVSSLVVVDAEGRLELVTLSIALLAAEVPLPTFAFPAALALETACPAVPDPQAATRTATIKPRAEPALT